MKSKIDGPIDFIRFKKMGAKFYTPTGNKVSSYKEIIGAWMVYRYLCFKLGKKVWAINHEGKITEVL